jgi:tetratricopeptide (TPR) repeat protein
MTDDIEDAVKEFNHALEKNPELDEQWQSYIVNILIEQNYYAEALVFLLQFVDSGNVNAKMFFDIGHCYEELEDIEKAEEFYEKSLDEDPFNEKTWVILGSLYLQSSNVDKALEAFEYALSINKDDHTALILKTAALMKSGEYDKAIHCLLEILSNSSEYRDALCNLGECYEITEDLEKAEECYSKSISDDVSSISPSAYWSFSRILYAQGNIEAAIRVIDDAIEIEPNNEDFLYFRGQCLISLSHDKDKLVNILQNIHINESLSEDPEFVNKYKKAVFFYNVRSMEECCKYLLDAISINSEGLEMFFNLFPRAKDDAYIINYFGKYLK